MPRAKNIVWIMCDQLRHDYLGCSGHPKLKTPNIDAMAERGVRFRNAYVQSPICGPSRMSFYTGRYMRSHGSHWNGWPLRVGEPTLGDHLKKIGVRNVLVGKTHMAPDLEGMKLLGIPPDSIIGVHVAECGFEPYERDDGLHPTGRPRPRYDAYLREHGYEAQNPWEHWANSGADAAGSLQNGWLLAHSDKAARIPEQHSETPYMTRRAMDFISESETDERPWCLHLSYIKPHWPYIAPEPYASMYGAGDVQPAVRSQAERQSAHPVFAAYMSMRYSRNMARDEARAKVIPAYMGLITQIDDQMGVLMEFLGERGLLDTTMIVFTSDHGDYLGDHWMGEKDLFHDASAKIPLIVIDPSPEADAARGTVCDALVEAIDLAPTFVDYFGGEPPGHILEGRSLMPLIRGKTPSGWRKVAFSEYDYAMQDVRLMLDQPIERCRLFMVFDGRWKLIHASGFRPMLYDLASDPQELVDRGEDPSCAAEIARLQAALFDWALHPNDHITTSRAKIAAYADNQLQVKGGVLIGIWDEAELAAIREKIDQRKTR
ncbi:alkaline phosphatase family protein [Bradyrhizobium sp.]|uniref:alkaline phosphatase family protein n=1 Tax=Bradyrhizobium sp. TaxID=376 RepID=UPI003C62DAE0